MEKLTVPELKKYIKFYKTSEKITGLKKKELVALAKKLQASGTLKKQKKIRQFNHLLDLKAMVY